MDLASHPLVSTMHRSAEINQFFSLPVREPEQGGWIEATDLFLGDDQRLRNLVMTYGQKSWGTTNNHVSGSAFIIAYLTRLVWPVIGQYVLQHRVPKVSLDNVAFHRNEGGIDAMHQAAGASVKVSQNVVANSCTQAFHWLYLASKDPASIVREASTFFDDPDSPVYGQVSMEVFEHRGKQGFFSRRRGRCLAWRTGRAHGYCSNCILLPRDQQNQQFQDLLERGG